MMTMIETKTRIRKHLKWAGWVAVLLMSAGSASAWDDGSRDAYRTGRSDSGSVGAAYRAELHVDPNGAVIRHQFNVVALFAAVIGDIARPIVTYSPEYRGSHYPPQASPHTRTVVHETHITRHRHHRGCRHPATAWRAGRHHVGRTYAGDHHHGHAKHHNKGRGHNKGYHGHR